MSGYVYSNPIQTGVANSIPIIANALAGALGFDTKQTVTLMYNYSRSPPPEFPVADTGDALATSYLVGPRTIPSGTVITVFACEAIALVAASVAHY
jgi:hypothetical protein